MGFKEEGLKDPGSVVLGGTFLLLAGPGWYVLIGLQEHLWEDYFPSHVAWCFPSSSFYFSSDNNW